VHRAVLFDKHDTAKMHGLDAYDVSSSSCRAVLFDKLDTAKMHGLDTSNVSTRDVTRAYTSITHVRRSHIEVKSYITQDS